MLFNSLQFVIFFPIVVLGYFLLPHRFRWLFMLIASCVFYMAFIPAYILILVATIVVDYIAGIYIESAKGRRRKMLLVLSIISNVSFLAFFKYFNFFSENINELAQFLHWNYSLEALKIILPVGLSFHTFQAMSYTIEVYRGNQKAERHFGIYALYVMFFPQLVAGPIERPQNLLPQFRKVHTVDWTRMRSGAELMLWGFFKKIVIADNLAVGVNVVYNNVSDFNGTAFIVATIFFAYQIYCDFSGYSDIARGAARILGFELMVNFKDPYASRSVSEFWTRWHISLSTWFRDYLYIPLGGNRVSRFRVYVNLFTVFLVSGFWHGANWTFVAWGAVHGVYLVSSMLTKDVRRRFVEFTSVDRFPFVLGLFQVTFVFLLANIGWIFFRATSIHDAIYIMSHLFSGLTFDAYYLTLTKGTSWMLYCVSMIAFLEIAQYLARNYDVMGFLKRRPAYVLWTIYMIGTVVILLSGSPSESQFIYFQF